MVENDRRVYLSAMTETKEGMVLGVGKNTYVEPSIRSIERARSYYNYPVTRSN